MVMTEHPRSCLALPEADTGYSSSKTNVTPDHPPLVEICGAPRNADGTWKPFALW